MYQDIMNKTTLEFPRHLSRESIDLMKKMLDKNPITRLCHPDDIRAHPSVKELTGARYSAESATLLSKLSL